MNKLYFLRGFGTGVIFCVFILGIACAYRTSDGEVIRQARELGMVFASDAEDEKEFVFASTAPAITAAPDVEEKTDDKGDKKEETPSPEPTPSPTPKETEVPSPSPAVSPSIPEGTKQPKEQKPEKDTGKISLQITKGMWSDAVSAALEQKGLVKDAAEFDKFLNKNGYASFIRVGTFQIPKDATYEQIATIITSDN